MGTDLDPLDDIFVEEEVKNARAANKFQPKPKFRPQKKGSTAAKISSQADQTTESAQTELNEVVGTAKSSEHSSDVLPNDNGGQQASMGKPVGENADIFIGLETLGDILPHAKTDTEGRIPPSEAEALNVPNPEHVAEKAAIPVISSVEDSTNTFKAVDIASCPDPLTADEPIVSSTDGHGHMHDRELAREEMDVMDSIVTSELTTKSGQRTGKFQPKPKIQMHKEKETRGASGSVSHSQSVLPEISYGEKELISTFQQDDVLDLSSLELAHALPTDVTSEVPLNEDSMNLMEMTQLDSGTHLEGVPEFPAKLASRRANTASNKNHTALDSSPTTQENVTGRSLRPRKTKTNLCELVDEDENEDLANGEFSEEHPLSSALELENIINEEHQVESEPQKKAAKRRSKKADDDKEKPARKRKNAKETSDQDAAAKPKKFSHSTRRRRVDKALLETPEDEIDYQKVPLRDLILLAEYKEKQTKKEEKEAAAPALAPKPSANQSNGNSSGRYNEDETFTSNQDGEYDDGQGSPMVEDSTLYFNYQTYMDKTPIARWSKQDTELFYEAVRQFGTDLSMIQQLFPDRTRRQIKLKYKKEERQHPHRLREALTNRSKNLSHFQMVIDRLNQMAAEENQNADEDAIDLTGNEVADEGTSNADDEEAKDEAIEEEEHGDGANDAVKVQSPIKSDDGEDDLFLWSQYKSDT